PDPDRITVCGRRSDRWIGVSRGTARTQLGREAHDSRAGRDRGAGRRHRRVGAGLRVDRLGTARAADVAYGRLDRGRGGAAQGRTAADVPLGARIVVTIGVTAAPCTTRSRERQQRDAGIALLPFSSAATVTLTWSAN